MTSPQLENGYTRIANELLEALARTRIPGEAIQVLWAVLRQTYGFGRKVAPISLGQLSKFTGLSRSNCQRAVQRLVGSNIVLKSEYRGVTSLGIQKDFSKWKVYSKKSICTQKRVQGVLKNECKTVLNIESPIKKERNSLKKPSSDALRLSGLLADLIASNNPSNRNIKPSARSKSVERWAMDIDRMFRLDGRSPEEAEAVIRWCQADSFWGCNVLSGTKLREQYDRLLLQMQRDKDSGQCKNNETLHLNSNPEDEAEWAQVFSQT